MLEKNQIAPAFSSSNQDNQIISLADFAGKQHVVLYFYPRDDTPGCTIEANQFTELASEFAANDTVVIGVSKDSCASHQPLSTSLDSSWTCWPIPAVSYVRPMVCGRRRKRMARKKWVSCVRPLSSIRNVLCERPYMVLPPMAMRVKYWGKLNNWPDR